MNKKMIDFKSIFAFMKNVVQYSVLFFLAFFICYGGAGVNLVSYCCGECRTAGMEAVLVDSCCEIHHPDKNNTTAHASGRCHHDDSAPCDRDACHDTNSPADCCRLERISFEWDNSTHQLKKTEPVGLDIPCFNLISAILLTGPDNEGFLSVEGYSPPPGVSPQVYLSLLTTLLI